MSIQQEVKQKAVEQPLASSNQLGKDISNWKLLLIGLGLGLILPLGLTFLLISNATPPPSPPPLSPEDQAKQNEIRARQDFANNLRYPLRGVSYSTEGKEKEILEINILNELPRSNEVADMTEQLMITDEIKKNAKALKFVKIHLKGGYAFGDPPNIDRTVDLRTSP